MAKKLSSLLLIISISLFAQAQKLAVSQNGRFIVNTGGKPFIWLGDTAWELFHRLNREEATEYLKKRASQGFTVIQAVILAENDGLRVPNSYGDLPLSDFSPEKPNEKYFEHVDFIINKANELGLYVGLLPTWGDKIYSAHPAAGPVVFNVKNAEIFGAYLGRRYKNNKLVWILGGDRNIDSDEVLDIWRAMAKGLKKGDGNTHLITFHPRGESTSSYWLHNEDWLDLNMYQSGHARHFNAVYKYAETDYLKNPAKPVIDGEPAYEDIPVKFWDYCDFSTPLRVPKEVLNDNGSIKDRSFFKDGFFTDYDVRVHAYWNLLSGACGYTYGNNAVWQMYKYGGPISIPCITDWRNALDRPGAQQILHIRHLLELRPVHTYIPDQSILYGNNAEGENHIRAARNQNNTSLAVYLSKGQQVKIVMKKINGDKINAYWYNPRNGNITFINELANKGIQSFQPASSGQGNDWLLILEDKSAFSKLK